jgi:hypothetical protein
MHLGTEQFAPFAEIFLAFSSGTFVDGRQNWGIGLTRDSLTSVRYAEGLNSSKSSATLQSTDRHDILGQKSAGFQLSL